MTNGSAEMGVRFSAFALAVLASVKIWSSDFIVGAGAPDGASGPWARAEAARMRSEMLERSDFFIKF